MTPDRYREVLGLLRMNPTGLSLLIDCDERLARRWASGRVPIPAELAAWLEDAAALYERLPIPKPEWNYRPPLEALG